MWDGNAACKVQAWSQSCESIDVPPEEMEESALWVRREVSPSYDLLMEEQALSLWRKMMSLI